MIMLLAKILMTTSVAFFSIVSAANTWNITVDDFHLGNSLWNRSISGVQTGDTLQFIFVNKVYNHSVTESTLDNPCVPIDGGMDTGLMRSPRIYRYKVLDGGNPIWFYSRTNPPYNFCKEHMMVFAVNPATNEQLETFFRNILPPSESSCSGVNIPIQKMIAMVALFAGLLAV